MVSYEVWCLQFMRADGGPANRVEFFTTEESARAYANAMVRNGATEPRILLLREVQSADV